jgi:phosphotransferase system HPr (HPr) family protein
MPSKQVAVNHKDGLHLRPAALFVQKAASYEADIQVRNVTKNASFQDAKSAIGVMMLKVSQGDTIEIKAEGSDADAALDGLAQLIANGFEES